MAIYNNLRLAFKQLLGLSDGDVVNGGNLARPTETTINESVTFNRVNLTNIESPNAEKDDCLEVKKDFCKHLHPDFDIPDEDVECRHWQGADLVDGEYVNQYKDLTV